MKFLLKLIIVVAVALAAVVVFRNPIVKAVAENGVRAVTGMPLVMGRFNLDLAKTFVDIESLVIKNPAEFHNTELVDIPKIFVGFDLPGALKGHVHLTSIEFDMKQFTVVKNEQGELNLDRLKALQGTQKAPAKTEEPQPGSSAKPMPVTIDLMKLRIGKVVYIDYSGKKPLTQEFRIDLDQNFKNITDLNSVVRLIVLKAMMSSGLANILHFDLGGLEGALTGAFDMSTELVGKVASTGLNTLKTAATDPGALAGQAGGVLKSTSGAVGSTAQGVAGGVKNAASSFKNKLFGKSDS